MAAATVIATLAVAAMATGQWLEEEVRPELQEIALASATEPEPTIPSASSQTAEIAKTLDEAAADPAEPAPASRTFSFKALPKSIRLSDEPVLGSPQAEHVVVELIDYTCKHCRQMHPFLRKAVERYDGQLAVVVLHTPLSSKCNPSAPAGRKGKRGACEYAQVALGVWRYDPSEFGGFHYWLMEGDKPPSILDANKRAAALFGDPFLLDSKRKDDAQRRITRNGAVLQRVNVGLPVLLFPESAISGVPAGEVEFFQLLETKLGLTLPTDAADN